MLVALSWLLPTAAHATHLRAGDIQAKVDTTPTHNPNRIFFKLTLYRDPNSQADTPVATMYFGDGTSATSPRSANVRISPVVTICTYFFDHTYPGASTWTASIFESNRVGNVVNIPGSVNQTFALSTTFQIRPGLGLNHSPVLKAPAIDQAASGKPYVHNPAAFDADGDSLGFRLIPSQQVLAPLPTPATYTPTLIPCSGFTYANNPAFGIAGNPLLNPPLTVAFNGVLAGLPSQLFIDRNGLITWNVPAKLGEYNIAFIVEQSGVH
ncbi:MAG: hypothetical protein EOO58_01160 [Hymenobacter sp.]|nr:MAG: hypothetical protein EOO58_01160 [Hymenobacter sp.]